MPEGCISSILFLFLFIDVVLTSKIEKKEEICIYVGSIEINEIILSWNK